MTHHSPMLRTPGANSLPWQYPAAYAASNAAPVVQALNWTDGRLLHFVHHPTLTPFHTCPPRTVLGRGYNHSVDWWTLGVLMYVLLTARQPFSSPKTHDPMEVMRRIVDDRWPVKYPPYMSPTAKDLISRLLERKPAKRIGMLQGRAADIKQHKWFEVGMGFAVSLQGHMPGLQGLSSVPGVDVASRQASARSGINSADSLVKQYDL